MTEHQIELLARLSKVTFVPGSYNKRFVRNLSGYTGELTEKQALLLDQMYHRYRRQIRNHEDICRVCSGEIEPSRRIDYNLESEDADKLERWKRAWRD